MSTQNPTEEQLRWELAQARKRISELQKSVEDLEEQAIEAAIYHEHAP